MKKSINEKAFTMVELIATIAIMAIILLMAVPNILGVVDKNKKTTYVNDAKKLISAAKSKFEADTTLPEPTSNFCLVFKLDNLNTKLQKGPNSGSYDKDYSYVTVTKENTKYIYGVQLVEAYKSGNSTMYRGIAYTKTTPTTSSVKRQNADKTVDYKSLLELSAQNGTDCPSGLAYTNGKIEGNYQNNIKVGDKLSVSYKIGSNVEAIGKTEDSCTVTSSYTKECEVTLPSLTPEEGYSSIGWATSNGNKTGSIPGAKIKLKNKSIIYYANAIDNIAPTIEMSAEEDAEYSKDKKIDITIKDLGSGLKENATIEYGLSTSKATAPTVYKKLSFTYEKGEKEASATIYTSDYRENLNGKYYLWIKQNIEDVKGNKNNGTTISKGTFNINNTNSSCRFEPDQAITITTGGQVTLSLVCTDDQVGIEDKQLTKDDFFTSVDDIISINNIKRIVVTSGYKYDITISGENAGSTTLVLPAGTISNKAGNSGDDDTETQNIKVENKVYSIEYRLGSNATSLSKTKDSCTVIGNSNECTITLPDYVVGSGYTKTGYSKIEDDINGQQPNSTITLTGNIVLYANAIDNTIPTISIDKQESTTYSKEQQVNLTIKDNGSGLSNNVSFAYGWSTSNEDSPETITSVTIPLDNKKETTYTIKQDSLTGTYYLWIMPINISDKVGNTVTDNLISSGVFKFDNDAPDIEIVEDNSQVAETSKNIVVNITDYESKIVPGGKIRYGWTTDYAQEPTTISEISLTNTTNVEKTTIEINQSDLNGKYYLWIEPVNLKDTLGNTADYYTTSMSYFVFDTKPPIISIESVSPKSVSVGVPYPITIKLKCDDASTCTITNEIVKNTIIYVGTNKNTSSYVTNYDNATLTIYITVNSQTTGKIMIIIPPNAIKDEVGNYASTTSLSTNISVYKDYQVTNLIKNNSFQSGTTDWELSGGARVESCGRSDDTVTNNCLTFSAGQQPMAKQTLSKTSPTINHKYYGSIWFYSYPAYSSDDARYEWFYNDVGKNSSSTLVFADKRTTTTLNWKLLSSIQQITSSTYLDKEWTIRNFAINATDKAFMDSLTLVDLTETFGSGNEPSKEWCDENLISFSNSKTVKYY